MSIRFRSFDPHTDFELVSSFLIENYRDGNRDGNCLQPIWEYSYTHPATRRDLLDRIGLWEDSDGLCGVVFFETDVRDVFLNRKAGYGSLGVEMVEYAEAAFGSEIDGDSGLHIFARDADEELNKILGDRGYDRVRDHDRTMCRMVIPEPFGPPEVPPGFVLESLSSVIDIRKMHRVLHRGFNHEGDPPEEGLPGRELMQSGPGFRADLTTVCIAPDGEFVSYCGIWFVEQNGYAYVEPVAVDPDYRRRGIGTATVLEGIRKAALLGARAAYVWTDLAFYLSFGFARSFADLCWSKEL